jgi:hypothetical protein
MSLPWLTRPGIPNSLNAYAEIARIAEAADSLEQGILYPRWAAHFHLGYGSPIFNYLAPLPHYLGGILMVLTEANPARILKTLMVICVFLAGGGMFFFVRRRWGEEAGILAALLYLLAPQILYRHYLETDLAVLMAAGLFPCFLWLLDRGLGTGDPRDIALLSLLTAFLLTASNLLGPVLLIMGCLWGIWVAFVERGHGRSATLGVVLGIGLAAVYWLPALVEWQAVHWVAFDKQLHPLTLGEALQLPSYPSEKLFNPFPPDQLGIATWGFALLGMAVIGYQFWRGQKSLVILPFLGSGTILFAMAIWLSSEWLDSTATFPRLSRTDLLIPVTACCTIVAAQVVHRAKGYRFSWVAGVVAAIGLSYTTFNPPQFVPYPAGDAISSYMESELRGSLSGSFRDGHLLPLDSPTLPPPSFPLLASYSLGQVSKVEAASRLSGSNLHTLSHGNQHDTLRVNNPLSETTIEVLTLNFPGWKASFEDQPIPITSTSTEGFIQITLPRGRGDLHITLKSTPSQTIGVLVSVASLAAVISLVWRWRFSQTPLPQQPSSRLTFGIQVMLALAILGLQHFRPPAASIPETHLTTPVVFEDEVILLGYDWNASDSWVDLTLYWQATHPNLLDYETQVRFIHQATGELLLVQHHRAPGGWLTSYWIPEKMVQDPYRLRIPADAPSGEYNIEVLVLRCDSSDNPYTCREPQPLISTPYPVILPDHLTIP